MAIVRNEAEGDGVGSIEPAVNLMPWVAGYLVGMLSGRAGGVQGELGRAAHLSRSRRLSSLKFICQALDLDHMYLCMKTITVNVSEPVYRDYQNYARHTHRTASDLIREAMELFQTTHMKRSTSLRQRRPASVGGPIAAITAEDDILGEMLDDPRD
jgi:hypothetical protein